MTTSAMGIHTARTKTRRSCGSGVCPTPGGSSGPRISHGERLAAWPGWTATRLRGTETAVSRAVPGGVITSGTRLPILCRTSRCAGWRSILRIGTKVGVGSWTGIASDPGPGGQVPVLRPGQDQPVLTPIPLEWAFLARASGMLTAVFLEVSHGC